MVAHPLTNGSEVPLDRTAVRLLADLIMAWISPRESAAPLDFLDLDLDFLPPAAWSGVTYMRDMMRPPLYCIDDSFIVSGI